MPLGPERDQRQGLFTAFEPYKHQDYTHKGSKHCSEKDGHEYSLPPEERPDHRNQLNVPSPHSLAMQYDDAEHCHKEKEPSPEKHPQDGIAYPYRGEPEAGAHPYDNAREGDDIGNDHMDKVDTGYDQQSGG